MQAFHSADDEQILWHYLQRLKQVSIWRPFSGRGFDIDSDYRVELVPGGGFVRVEQVTRHELMFNCSIDDHVYGCIESDSPQYWHFRVRGNCSKRVDGTNYRLSSLETRGPNSIKVFGLYSNSFMYGGGRRKLTDLFSPGHSKSKEVQVSEQVKHAMSVCQATGVQFEIAVLFAGLKAFHGFEHEGLFRTVGLASGVKKGKEDLEKRVPHCLKDYDDKVIASMIKKFVEVDMRHFPYRVSGEITEIVNAPNLERKNEKWNSLHSQVKGEVDLQSLCYLVYMLRQVEALSEVNKMTAKNLAICFGPKIVADPIDLSDPAKVAETIAFNATKLAFFELFLDGSLQLTDLTTPEINMLDAALRNCMDYFFK